MVSGLVGLPAQAQDYDLVILNGRVMDPETKLDAVRNVGVKDGKIATVTEDAIKGKETIDALNDTIVDPSGSLGWLSSDEPGQTYFRIQAQFGF
jgi:dihydroorotase-like cyclic amidohydrolase